MNGKTSDLPVRNEAFLQNNFTPRDDTAKNTDLKKQEGV